MRKIQFKAKYETPTHVGQIRLSRWQGGRVTYYEMTLISKPDAKVLVKSEEYQTIEKAIASAIKFGYMSSDWQTEYKEVQDPPGPHGRP